MAENGVMPEYVEYGGRATAPGEFECTEGRYRGLILKADRQKLEDLVDMVFNVPADGEVSFRVMTSYVQMLIGWFGKVRATTKPFDEWGTVREVQASIWVPLAQGREVDGEFKAERLVMAVPFIWVDNAMSYAGGRETYGYPKSLGKFEFEKDPNGEDHVKGPMTVSTYGGAFRTDNEAGWHPVLTIAPGRLPEDGSERSDEAGADTEKELVGEEAFVEYVSRGAINPNAESISVGDIKFFGDVISGLLKGQSRQLFLKQFRDVKNPKGACYQAVVEAPIQILKTKTRPTKGKWHVKVHPLDSHPVLGELGLESQTALFTFELDMDFICKRGEVIAQPRVPALTG